MESSNRFCSLPTNRHSAKVSPTTNPTTQSYSQAEIIAPTPRPPPPFHKIQKINKSFLPQIFLHKGGKVDDFIIIWTAMSFLGINFYPLQSCARSGSHSRPPLALGLPI